MHRSFLLVALGSLIVPLLSVGSVSAQGAAEDSLLTRASQGRSKGAERAPITIVEVADFQCPFCRQFSETTLPALDSLFVRTGRARVLFYNLPFSTHPRSWVAAEAAMCASAQGSFWPMHDLLFRHQARWGESAQPESEFEAYASEIGVNLEAFRDCIRYDRVAALLLADLFQSTGGGISATPTFIILREARPGEDPAQAQRILAGHQPIAEFEKAIEELSR